MKRIRLVERVTGLKVRLRSMGFEVYGQKNISFQRMTADEAQALLERFEH